MISCICVTGSTRINAHVRADLLWRMVNSMHEAPGHPFELILVDNCQGPSVHRKAIDQIFDTYRTVTHVIRNRKNQYHGGGVNQGVALATGDLLVEITDDLLWKPNWLHDLVAPLLDWGSPNHGSPPDLENPEKNRLLVAAPMHGHHTRSRVFANIQVGEKTYQLRTSAAAYCWAFWRGTFNRIGPWKDRHFADTRWKARLVNNGYCFVVPTWKIAVATNLNYLRPWIYKRGKKIGAATAKEERITEVFDSGRLTYVEPHWPTTDWPLKNPVEYGPLNYPEEWLREQGVPDE